MATTNDAMFEALAGSYPSTGRTLGDLLYAFWSEKGLEYRGSLAYQFFKDEGAAGDTLGDLANDYFVRVYPLEFDRLNFNIDDPDEWLELQVFDRWDTVEQEIFTLVW
jgi:hypothetical protein